MIMDQYAQLQQQSQQHTQTIGCILPRLRPAKLSIKKTEYRLSELHEALTQQQESIDFGWLQTPSKTLAFAAKLPDLDKTTAILEAELAEEARSHHIRHLHGDRFLWVTYEESQVAADAQAVTMVCRDSSFMVRANLVSDNRKLACYRHWWQLTEDHQWQPVAQVFKGFTEVPESREEA
ncbi:MAG: hypothetical protein AWU56_359 [Idiomarina sp. T82-3]|uniref:hypothetical protein n=1 Tax=Idiomarina TaxID=135575 RepID=UPI000796D7DF|nr:hypothetical protein [Idiomarina sp. T82-3]KXS36244.1 MAG: hypothetical protein AWU56_359 [Idiomarina sp. T82-3]